jgi:ApaG protein
MMKQDGIEIEVDTSFLADQSDPTDERFVFGYTITIRNQGKLPVRLINRRWLITDASGKTQEVEGEGVVGQQPTNRPGRVNRYYSLSVFLTPVGTIVGPQ